MYGTYVVVVAVAQEISPERRILSIDECALPIFSLSPYDKWIQNKLDSINLIKDICQFLWFYDFQEMVYLDGWLKTVRMHKKKPTNMLFRFWFFIIEYILFILYVAFMRFYIDSRVGSWKRVFLKAVSNSLIMTLVHIKHNWIQFLNMIVSKNHLAQTKKPCSLSKNYFLQIQTKIVNKSKTLFSEIITKNTQILKHIEKIKIIEIWPLSSCWIALPYSIMHKQHRYVHVKCR